MYFQEHIMHKSSLWIETTGVVAAGPPVLGGQGGPPPSVLLTASWPCWLSPPCCWPPSSTPPWAAASRRRWAGWATTSPARTPASLTCTAAPRTASTSGPRNPHCKTKYLKSDFARLDETDQKQYCFAPGTLDVVCMSSSSPSSPSMPPTYTPSMPSSPSYSPSPAGKILGFIKWVLLCDVLRWSTVILYKLPFVS